MSLWRFTRPVRSERWRGCGDAVVPHNTRRDIERAAFYRAVALLDYITDTAAFEFATVTGYNFLRSPEASIDKSRVP